MHARSLLLPFAVLASALAGCGGGSGAALPSTAVPQSIGNGHIGSSGGGSGSSTPAPVQATAAPVIPTAAPVAAAGMPALQNGAEYATSWRPYGSNAVWNQALPATPKIWSQSAAVIAQQFNSAGSQNVFVRQDEAGPYDYGHPIYYASSSDPVVTINCRTYCDHADNGGLPATVHIPAHARPAGGDDSHMAVIQPDATEIDFFGVTKPSGDWGSAGNTAVTAGSAMNCGSFVTGAGNDPNGAVTVGGACLGAGILRANELNAGRINHALFLVVNCAAPASQNQYPVQNGAGTDVCTNYSAGHAAPPLGARLWLDYSDAQIAAMSAAPWEKAIMYALHDYGAFIEDDVSGGGDISGFNLKTEGGDMFHAMGATDPYTQISGWNNVGTPSGSLGPRYVGGDPWQPAGVDFSAHMHYVDPCVTKQAC